MDSLSIEFIKPLERLKALVKVAEPYQHCGCAGIELFKELEAAKGAIDAAELTRALRDAKSPYTAMGRQ